MQDLISRQGAINAANRADYRGLAVEDVKKVTDEVVKELKKLPSAQPDQRWIPVTDHLPDDDVPVLVTDDAGGMATVGIDSCGRYEDTGERFWYTSQNVTAWMYTVEPYGGEQE